MKKILLAVLAAVLPLAASAQSWPQRPVKFVLPLGPGSGVDLTGRMLADRLTKTWGQPVVVENRPGGDGVIAINAVLAAKDDHTLLYGPASSFVGHPYTLEKMPYDAKDLLPVARVSNTVVTIAVPAGHKAQSLKELMDDVRAQPGKLNWTSITGVTDIVIGGYLRGAGLNMVRVPYKDPVSGLNDLVEGRIQMYSSAYAIVRTQAQSGRVRVLAVQARTRAPGLPGMPTVAEAGFPGLSFDGLTGILAARASGITDAQRDRIAADVRATVLDATISERMVATGQIVSPGSPAEFAAAIEEQGRNMAESARLLGIAGK